MKKIPYHTDQNNPAIKEYVAAVKKGMKKDFDTRLDNVLRQIDKFELSIEEQRAMIKAEIAAQLPKEKELHTHPDEMGGCANDIRKGYNQALQEVSEALQLPKSGSGGEEQ